MYITKIYHDNMLSSHPQKDQVPTFICMYTYYLLANKVVKRLPVNR